MNTCIDIGVCRHGRRSNGRITRIHDDVGERLDVGDEDIVNREIRGKHELVGIIGKEGKIGEVTVDGTTSVNGHNRRIHGSLGTNEFAPFQSPPCQSPPCP